MAKENYKSEISCCRSKLTWKTIMNAVITNNVLYVYCDEKPPSPTTRQSCISEPLPLNQNNTHSRQSFHEILIAAFCQPNNLRKKKKNLRFQRNIIVWLCFCQLFAVIKNAMLSICTFLQMFFPRLSDDRICRQTHLMLTCLSFSER